MHLGFLELCKSVYVIQLFLTEFLWGLQWCPQLFTLNMHKGIHIIDMLSWTKSTISRKTVSAFLNFSFLLLPSPSIWTVIKEFKSDKTFSMWASFAFPWSMMHFTLLRDSLETTSIPEIVCPLWVVKRQVEQIKPYIANIAAIN